MKSRDGNDEPRRGADARVAVIGNYGNRNLGDEATLASVLQFLKRHYPAAVVCALSERPEETRRRHGIAAAHSIPGKRSDRPAPSGRQTLSRSVGSIEERRLSLRAALKRVPPLYLVLRALASAPSAAATFKRGVAFAIRSFVLLRRTDLLIVAGGGQISDHFEGMWGFPLQLFTWCLLARCAGAQVVVLNVGAGPLRGRASRVLFRWTLGLAAYRSYRDERSRRLIGEIGVRDPGPVAPDLVFSWDPSVKAAASAGRTSAGRAVGLNVFPFRDRRYWSTGDEADYRQYLELITHFVRWLLDEGYWVRLFPTQLKADTRVIADVMRCLEPAVPPELAERLEVASIETVDELAGAVRAVDVVVATRFHAIVMAMLAGKPILALCNESKMADLMASMGQARHCLSLESLEPHVLKAHFLDLETQGAQAAAELREGVARARETLDRQLGAVFGEVLGRSVGAAPAGAEGGIDRLAVPRPSHQDVSR